MSDPRKTELDPDSADGPLSPEEERYAEEEAKRRAAEHDMEMPIVTAMKETTPEPVQPVRYRASDKLCFDCHKGISCWNACCYDTDIMLTPYDLQRLAGHFECRPADVVRLFGSPSVHDRSNMPVVKLKMLDRPGDRRKPCVFLDEVDGCTVYENRPAACRYYPLGLAAVKIKEQDSIENFYFMVREPHCHGHDEPKEQTVAEFREAQGVEPYDQQNADWIYILMKLTSWKSVGGPWGKEADARTKKMFYMASTDIDAFRQFVFNSSFFERYLVEPAMREELATSDEALLKLACDWLRNVLFNEPTIAVKEHVLREAIAKARRDMGGG